MEQLRNSLEQVLFDTIGKLKLSSLLILFPVFVVIYICIFVDDETIEKAVNIKHEHVVVVCPTCGDTLVISIRNIKKTNTRK